MTSLIEHKADAQPKSAVKTLLDGLFLIGAGVLGYFTAQSGIDFLVPGLLMITALAAIRMGFSEPYYKTFTAYLAVVAFNYYYFYCSALTGRNPTDFAGVAGTMATPLEQIQKDILFAVILGIGLIKLVGMKLENRPILLKRFNHPMMYAIFLLILYSVFRAGILISEGEALFEILAYLRTNIEYALLPLVFCTALVRNEKDLRTMVKGILYTMGVVAVLGLIEFFIQGSVYVKSFYGGQTIYRATATLQNPNNLGCYLATTTGVFILYFYRNQLRRWERNLFWMTMPLGFACLFMTLSRSSILTFFMALTLSFIVLFLTAERGKSRGIACRNLMVAYILVLSVSLLILYRYFDFNNALKDAAEVYLGDSGVGNYRTFALFSTLKHIVESPFGLLIGFSKLASKSIPDNTFAFLLMRNGIVGFLLYMFIWLKGIHTSWIRVMDRTRSHSFLYLVCFYILTFQFLYSFSGNVMRAFPHNLYFWVTIGIIVWLESQPARTHPAAAEIPAEQVSPP